MKATDRWWNRPTLAKVIADLRDSEASPKDSVDQARLSRNEFLNLASVTTVEIYTPASIRNLIKSIEFLPIGDHVKSEARRHIVQSRQDNRTIGPYPLCTAVGATAPDYYLVPNNAFRDASLPKSVERVTVVGHNVTPSATLVTCTFRIHAAAGSLSPIQQSEQKGTLTNLRVTPNGSFSRIRSKMMWTRPKSVQVELSHRSPHSTREAACQKLIQGIELACSRWASFGLPGPIGRAPFLEQPIGRSFILCNFFWPEQTKLPHEVGIWDFTGVRLGEIWATDSRFEWLLATSGFRERPNTVTACRTVDVPDDSAPDDGTLRAALSNFSEKFDDYMARWGLLQALALFRRELIQTRDASTSENDALGSAQKVSRYLSTGGADAAIVATDISQADELPLFFKFDQRLLNTQGKPASTALHLHDAIREILQRNARQLLIEHNTTVTLLTSHSQLLLASENGKLQNKLSWYTRLAFFIAAASLIVALCQLFQDEHQTSSNPTETGSSATKDR